MKKVPDIFSRAVLGIISLPVVLISFLIILVTYPFRVIDSRKRKKEYRNYLSQLNDKYILCYNEQDPHKSLLEQAVLPYLPKSIDIIYVESKVPISDHPATFVIPLLTNIQNRDGHPHLLKIKNGEIQHQSILNELTVEGKPADGELLFYKIMFFFNLPAQAILKVI